MLHFSIWILFTFRPVLQEGLFQKISQRECPSPTSKILFATRKRCTESTKDYEACREIRAEVIRSCHIYHYKTSKRCHLPYIMTPKMKIFKDFLLLSRCLDWSRLIQCDDFTSECTKNSFLVLSYLLCRTYMIVLYTSKDAPNQIFRFRFQRKSWMLPNTYLFCLMPQIDL